jgi:hypothetical protein
MALKVDYYTSLSRAVAGLDRDAYAARGYVYDREHKALMRHLLSADPPHTAAEIEHEQRAFRAAVRRIEFGDDDVEVPLAPQREPVEEQALPAAEQRTGLRPEPPAPQREASSPLFLPPKPAEAQDGGPSLRSPDRGPLTAQRMPVAAEGAIDISLDSAPHTPAPSALDPAVAAALLQRRPIAGRVFRRALLGIVLLALGAIAYDALTGEIGFPFVSRVSDTDVADVPAAAPPSKPTSATRTAPAGTQQVILFDSNRPDPNVPQFPGTASWRLRLQNEPSPVVTLDLSVPGRKVLLTMTMRREPPGSAMTHLFEFRFLRDDKEPDPDIVNIAAPFMTTSEMSRPNVLVGQVVSVSPGVFLFGLSGDATAREKNLRSLQDLAWMGIPIAYRNGVAGLIVVEKGVDGQRALGEALRQ